MDSRAKQIEIGSQEYQSAEVVVELSEVALALVGGGCGEIIVG